jgi:hypothetical protein
MQVGPTSPTPLARRRMGGAGTPRLGRRSGTPSCRRAGNGTVSHRISAHPLIGAWRKKRVRRSPSSGSPFPRRLKGIAELLHQPTWRRAHVPTVCRAIRRKGKCASLQPTKMDFLLFELSIKQDKSSPEVVFKNHSKSKNIKCKNKLCWISN